jgi:hypothetical protein
VSRLTSYLQRALRSLGGVSMTLLLQTVSAIKPMTYIAR